jgi:hypothetical protein
VNPLALLAVVAVVAAFVVAYRFWAKSLAGGDEIDGMIRVAAIGATVLTFAIVALACVVSFAVYMTVAGWTS